ncbi:hypothetical protein BDN70DRAFT_811829 [Pholiota conissans]|uniref:SH3 domain-containing protein n=1 Tax=Pholiota conissans TaxID=109636 RepID=A0A9P5YWE7_9AGAR|nr:hypothetical protein BDN70DRAFT_811829 [Pholiota conissans]
MPAFNLLPRSVTASSASSSPSINQPIYIAGVIVAVVIVLIIAVWLGIRAYRKRLAAKREEKMGAAFLSVKGLVREDSIMTNEKVPEIKLQRSATQINSFSRDKMDESVVLPARARLSPSNAAEVIEAHRQSGSFPTPFAPKPFSFALDPQRASMLEPGLRHSFMSTSSQNRFSVMSSTSSFDSISTLGTMRKVRQMYDPVLPDELLVRLGEQLTVVQSFDDGWCVVGRENASLVQSAKSLFKTARVDENNVEMGVVPAWCFLKPVKGLRAERPMRSTSLGITVNIDAAGHSSRNDMVSWSNF